MSEGLTRLVVTRFHDGSRLDSFLAEVTGLSRRAARRAISSGALRRNGDPLRVQGRRLQTGDVVDTGAPVGVMGGRTQQTQQILIESASASGQDRSETLYIEVRQGQTPLDPGRWFADATK